MNRRLFLRSGLILGAGACITGFGPIPSDSQQTWVPGHVENNDPTWGLLNGAQVAIDEARGLMTANFTDSIRHMNGQTMNIGGFLMPLDSRARFTHFVLTRRNSSCPFCPANLPTEAIEVFSAQPLEYGPDEYAVSGRFQLVEASAEGLFYKIVNAHVSVAPS